MRTTPQNSFSKQVLLNERTSTVFGGGNYRFGFQNQEMDDEIKGEGNSYDFGARMLDPRLGRWLTIDPQFKKQPSHSPFKAFFNNPNYWIDKDGNTEYEILVLTDEKSGKSITFHVSKSSKVKTDGVVHYDDGNLLPYQNYYDYSSKKTTITFHKDGNISITETKKIMKNNGIKYTDFVPLDEIFGKTAKKGSIYDPKDPFIQAGGFFMTGSDGEGSKYYSKNASYVGKVDDLISGIGGRTTGGIVRRTSSISSDEILDLLKTMSGSPEKTEPIFNLIKKVYDGVQTKDENFGVQKLENNTAKTCVPTIYKEAGRFGCEHQKASLSQIESGDTLGVVNPSTGQVNKCSTEEGVKSK